MATKKCAREIRDSVQMRLEGITSPTVIQLVVMTELRKADWPVTIENIEHITDAVNGDLLDPTAGRDDGMQKTTYPRFSDNV